MGVFAAVSTAAVRPASAELTKPQASDRQVTLVVTSLVRREHLSKHALDDEISERCLTGFLKMIDPMKVYFYKSDVEEFSKRRLDLDDMVKKGDITFGYTVFKRFLQRVDERVKLVDELLAAEHDFTIDEDLVTDPDQVEHPANEKEARDRWRKRIKYDLLALKADEKEEQEARDRLTRRYHSFAKRMHQTDSDELLEMYLTSMTTGFDPHTTYMSPTTLTNFRINMGLKLEGIGAALRVDDGYTIVAKIIVGGAADKEGSLKHEDRIVSVGEGKEGEMVDVVDMKLSDVVKMIRGKAGTIVRLGVVSTGETKTKIITITRAKIELKDSEARGVIFEEGKKADGTPYKIGVIDLPSFYMDMKAARDGADDFKSTTKDVKKILDDFNEKGVDALVLDLRRNGGGSLTEAIKLTGLFIDEGPVVQVKDSSGKVQHYDDQEEGMAWKGPLVVVTSKLSASASEILAGAIQDYQRGLIVGDTATHGKGTVQSLLDLGAQLFRTIPNPPNLGALKITMQQFYRPNGDSTQMRGVLADIKLPAITNHMDIGEEDLEFPIKFDRVPSARYDKLSLVENPLLAELRTRSSTRQEKSEEFAKLVKKIERYREQKERKKVSLNEEKFMARRAELDTDEEERKPFDDPDDPDNKEIVKRDFYFNEVLAITLDYLELLDRAKIAAVK